MENPNDQDLLNIGQEMIENYKDRLPNENLDATIENVVENQDHQLEFFSVLNSNLVSYAEFYENFILANRPCLLETTADMYDWEAVQNWCIKSDTEANSEAVDDSKKQHCSSEVINLEYLSLQFGSCSVSVTNCDNILQNYEESKCEMMSLSDYLHYLLDYRSKRYPASMPCLYLKDWHLMRQIEENLVESIIPYKIPKYFASDWLNETSKEQGDDFRFIYIGPKGSWTPFHSDVYGSYSWSANVIGIKKWFLYPPGKEERFRRSGNMFKFDFQNPGVENFDYYEVIQKKGQVIFVPSGWYHIVWNLEDTISINHNWMNAANVGYIWSNLKKALIEVKKELEDLKDLIDFREICQNLLKANHGMDYTIFIKILSTVFENRRNGLSYTSSYHFASNHKKFDIMILKNLFNEMKHDEEVRELLSGSECQVLHEAWISGIRGEMTNGYCSGGTCGCSSCSSGTKMSFGGTGLACQNNTTNMATCLCGSQPPCATSSVTGKCCRKPMNSSWNSPKPIIINFKCPTYCIQPPILLDPCCPPPIPPPTNPSPPIPGTCYGSKQCGCKGY